MKFPVYLTELTNFDMQGDQVYFCLCKLLRNVMITDSCYSSLQQNVCLTVEIGYFTMRLYPERYIFFF